MSLIAVASVAALSLAAFSALRANARAAIASRESGVSLVARVADVYMNAADAPQKPQVGSLSGAPTRRDVTVAAALAGLTSIVPNPVFAEESFSQMGGVLVPYAEPSKGFKIYRPLAWNMFGAVPGERDVKWQDTVESQSTIIVSTSPLASATSIDALGDLDTAAAKFAKSRDAQLVAASTRDADGSLVYVLDLKGETMHELLALTINRGQLYRVIASTSNKRWYKRKELFKNVIGSFVPKGY